MVMVGFHSKEKADRLAGLGFNYVVNKYHDNQNDYLFILTDDIIDRLDKLFETHDYYLTNNNRLLF